MYLKSDFCPTILYIQDINYYLIKIETQLRIESQNAIHLALNDCKKANQIKWSDKTWDQENKIKQMMI